MSTEVDGRMVTHLVERSPLLRAKPIMKDASLAALSDEKMNQTIIRDASFQAALMTEEEEGNPSNVAGPETKGRGAHHELSCERLLDRKNSLLENDEKYRKLLAGNTEDVPFRNKKMIL